MKKQFRCNSLGLDCDWTGIAETEQELMKMIAAHAKIAHDLSQITDEYMAKIQANIKNI